MPLQNRVTPFAEIVATPDRGTLIGNRGILHDETRAIVRQWQVRRWIACRLEYKNIRREIMRPHSWTELFFLDEATAFAAGHRPCCECRRDAYKQFQALWKISVDPIADADSMDVRMHAARLDRRQKRTYREALDRLPDGTMVTRQGGAWLVRGSRLLEWSSAGYQRSEDRPRRLDADVLTPAPVVAVLAVGYQPAIHASADRFGRP